jgi:hypothetical protein
MRHDIKKIVSYDVNQTHISNSVMCPNCGVARFREHAALLSGCLSRIRDVT